MTSLRDGHEYRVEREQIELTGLSPRPDPDWRYTDPAGHEHDSSYALLIRVQDDPDEPPFYVDDDGEEWNAPDHLECRLCGEHIEPGTIGPSPFREFVPGPVRYYRDDVEITEAEFVAAEQEAASRPSARPSNRADGPDPSG